MKNYTQRTLEEFEEKINTIINCDNACCVKCALDRKELKSFLAKAIDESYERGRQDALASINHDYSSIPIPKSILTTTSNDGSWLDSRHFDRKDK